MKQLERTQQQVDPALSMDSRVGTLALCTLTLLWGTGSAVVNIVQTERWLPNLVALFLVAVAVAVVIRQTAPLRAPFTEGAHVAVHALLCLAYLMTTLASDHATVSLWARICLLLVIVAMSRYRPPREILLAGTLSCLAVASATVPLIMWPPQPMGVPPLALLLNAVLPVAAGAVAAASYSQILVSTSERWKSQAELASQARAESVQNDIERAQYRERLRALGDEAFPFLRQVLAKNALSDADRDLARDIAARLRTTMVAEVDRTWLQEAMGEGRDDDNSGIVDDPDGCAPSMLAPQRAALRALLGSLSDSPRLDRLTVSIRAADGICRCEVWARFQPTDLSPPLADNTHLAALPVVFTDVTINTSPHRLIVRFSFDHL